MEAEERNAGIFWELLSEKKKVKFIAALERISFPSKWGGHKGVSETKP